MIIPVTDELKYLPLFCKTKNKYETSDCFTYIKFECHQDNLVAVATNRWILVWLNIGLVSELLPANWEKEKSLYILADKLATQSTLSDIDFASPNMVSYPDTTVVSNNPIKIFNNSQDKVTVSVEAITLISKYLNKVTPKRGAKRGLVFANAVVGTYSSSPHVYWRVINNSTIWGVVGTFNEVDDVSELNWFNWEGRQPEEIHESRFSNLFEVEESKKELF